MELDVYISFSCGASARIHIMAYQL